MLQLRDGTSSRDLVHMTRDLIVDDFGAVRACRRAVHDYRTYRIAHGVTERVHEIGETGVYWQRLL
jgi:Macrocin-O-methyltransferase (TylF)